MRKLGIGEGAENVVHDRGTAFVPDKIIQPLAENRP
jgi:hypothetical protein